jgi:hypothetical protein
MPGPATLPPYFDARSVYRKRFPDMAAYAKIARPLLSKAQDDALARESNGKDTYCLRAALTEFAWRIGSTSDVDAAKACWQRCQDIITASTSYPANTQDDQGSFGPCTEAWFLKLDRSTDPLVDGPWPAGAMPPRFLDTINTPERMISYLDDLLVSDIAKGVDKRKELNLASAVIARVALWGDAADYLESRRFRSAYLDFLDRWQDPETGFFCHWYRDGSKEIKTLDLSLTFHMVRYASRYEPQAIDYWPRIVETVFAISGRPYPQGWLDGDGMTNHNNYDVVELYRLGWEHMDSYQRRIAAQDISGMLDWCLTQSITFDAKGGATIANTDNGDSLPDNYYFAAAFLDTIGYFDKTKRFWSDRDFPQAEALRQAMIERVRTFNPNLPETIDALARLGAHAKAPMFGVDYDPTAAGV